MCSNNSHLHSADAVARLASFSHPAIPMCPESVAEPRLKSVRILVVDGDRPSAKLIQAVLEQEGCQLRVAESAKDALELGRSFEPHLVLTELVLKDLSGADLLKLFRADPSLRNAVIVAVTASNGPETKRLVLEVGGGGYIRKPIDALSFAAELASHLGRHVESARFTDEGGRTD